MKNYSWEVTFNLPNNEKEVVKTFVEDTNTKPDLSDINFTFQDLIYSDDTKIIGLQNTINCLNIRINYMLATGQPKEKVLPFIAELKELVYALEFGTTYTKLQTQKWREHPLGLKGSILYSLR